MKVKFSKSVDDCLNDFDVQNSIRHEFEQRLASLFSIAEFCSAHSVLLFGSVARGEQSCFEYQGSLQCLSDIEALVLFTSTPSARVSQSIQAKVAEVETKWQQRSPLFHLDVGIGAVDRLRRLPRSIMAFEMRERGAIIHGDDVRSFIPRVTPDQIDLGIINELILIRLWSLLLYMPRRIASSAASQFEEIVFRYILCRNSLEILTILYPNFGVLLPGYQERFAYLSQVSRLPAYSIHFDQDFAEFMRLALQGKLSPASLEQMDGLSLYRKTLDAYFALISFLIEEPLNPEMPDWDVLIVESKLRLRDKRIVRRNAHELWQAWLMSKRTGIGAALRWAVSPRRRLAICFLMHMHLSLLAWLGQNGSAALDHINEAEQFLCSVWPEPETLASEVHTDYPTRWLALRERFIPFMTHFYRFNRLKEPHFRKVHNWIDDA